MEEASWRRHHGGGIVEEESWRRHHGGSILEVASWRRLASLGWPRIEGLWGHPGGIRGDAQAAQAQEGLPGGSEGAGLIKVVPLSFNLHLSEKTTILLSVFAGQLTIDRYLR